MQILCEQGNADVHIQDTKSGNTLLHYAAIGQGNATLYIKYLSEKQGMSVLVKNKQRLTPRQYAQRTDRFKFHRVIKVLREMEEREMNLTSMRLEDE